MSDDGAPLDPYAGQPYQPAYPPYPLQPSYPPHPPQSGYPPYPAAPGYPMYPGQPGYPPYPAQAGYPAYPAQPAYQPYPVGSYPPYPYRPLQPGRPGVATAAAVLAHVAAGLLILAGFLLVAGAVGDQDTTSPFGDDRSWSSVTGELLVDGLINCVTAGLLITGGVQLTGRRAGGRTLIRVGAGIVVASSLYWTIRSHGHGGVVFFALVYAALVVIAVALAQSPRATLWVRNRSETQNRAAPPTGYGPV